MGTFLAPKSAPAKFSTVCRYLHPTTLFIKDFAEVKAEIQSEAKFICPTSIYKFVETAVTSKTNFTASLIRYFFSILSSDGVVILVTLFAVYSHVWTRETKKAETMYQNISHCYWHMSWPQGNVCTMSDARMSRYDLVSIIGLFVKHHFLSATEQNIKTQFWLLGWRIFYRDM